MSSVTGAKGRVKKTTPAKSSAKASGVVKSLSGEQIEALAAVTGATIVKGSKKDITKDNVQYSVDTYEVTLEISKTINANALAKSAKAAVSAKNVASAGELGDIANKISAAAEKTTIVKALKELDGIVEPAKAARINL